MMIRRHEPIRHHQVDPTFHGLCHKCVIADQEERRRLALDRCGREFPEINKFLERPEGDPSDAIEAAEQMARWLEAIDSCAIDTHNLDEYIADHFAPAASSTGKMIRKAILEGCDGEGGAA